MTPSTSAERLAAMMISLRDQVDRLAIEVRAQRVADSRGHSMHERRISRLEAALQELDFEVKEATCEVGPRAMRSGPSHRVEVSY